MLTLVAAQTTRSVELFLFVLHFLTQGSTNGCPLLTLPQAMRSLLVGPLTSSDNASSHLHLHTHAHIHTYTYTHTHTRTHTYTYTHTHTHTHTRTHTHSLTVAGSPAVCDVADFNGGGIIGHQRLRTDHAMAVAAVFAVLWLSFFAVGAFLSRKFPGTTAKGLLHATGGINKYHHH